MAGLHGQPIQFTVIVVCGHVSSKYCHALAAPQPPPYAQRVELIYHGHSCWELIGGSRLLFDPFLAGSSPTADVGPDDFDNLDAIVVTHAHGDHITDVEAVAKRTGAMVIANFEIAGYFADLGCSSHGMHVGGGHHFEFGAVKLTIAHHGSTTPDGVTLGQPCGAVVTVDGRRVYHAGDTGVFLDMRLIAELNGPLDVALLPIGDNFTMGITDAIKATELLAARMHLPMHFGTFPLIDVNPKDFVRGVESAGRSACALRPGESYRIP